MPSWVRRLRIENRDVLHPRGIAKGSSVDCASVIFPGGFIYAQIPENLLHGLPNSILMGVTTFSTILHPFRCDIRREIRKVYVHNLIHCSGDSCVCRILAVPVLPITYVQS